jgi:hypothetical protein
MVSKNRKEMNFQAQKNSNDECEHTCNDGGGWWISRLKKTQMTSVNIHATMAVVVRRWISRLKKTQMTSVNTHATMEVVVRRWISRLKKTPMTSVNTHATMEVVVRRWISRLKKTQMTSVNGRHNDSPGCCAPFFSRSTSWFSPSGDNPQECLARTGYKWIVNVKCLKILLYFWLATLIFPKFWSNYGNSKSIKALYSSRFHFLIEHFGYIWPA